MNHETTLQPMNGISRRQGVMVTARGRRALRRGIAGAMVLATLCGVAHAQPDLQVTGVAVACSITVPIPSGPTRFVQRHCDSDHQAELSVTVENKGTSNAVLTAGEIWNLTYLNPQALSSPIGAFVKNPVNLHYYPPIAVDQSGPLSGQPLMALLKSRTMTLKPGARLVETVMLVPARQLTVGSHEFRVMADPQGKVGERNEGNNISSPVRLTVANPPPDEEWVSCPSIGVSSRLEMEFENGKVTCRYWHQTRSELMVTHSVESQYLKPFRSCLRGNANYGAPGDVFREFDSVNRMYCSFTKNPLKLVRESTAWQSSSSHNKRVRFGVRTTPAGTEHFEICRVRYAGSLRVGRGWRGRCYIPYQNGEQRIDTGIEYLGLTRPYGVPAGAVASQFDETKNIQPVVDANAPAGVEIRFCTIFLRPADFAQTLGLAKDLALWVPGILVPGGVCVSSAQGKTVTSTVNTHGLHGGHMLVLH